MCLFYSYSLTTNTVELPSGSMAYDIAIDMETYIRNQLPSSIKPGCLTWQYEKILNSLPPKDTLNLQLHMEQFPPKKPCKPAEQLIHVQQHRREQGHMEAGRKSRPSLAISPSPGTVTFNRVGCSKSGVSP